MTAIEKAAIELDSILYSYLGDTDDWLLKIEYKDDAVATRFIAALNTLHELVRREPFPNRGENHYHGLPPCEDPGPNP